MTCRPYPDGINGWSPEEPDPMVLPVGGLWRLDRLEDVTDPESFGILLRSIIDPLPLAVFV